MSHKWTKKKVIGKSTLSTPKKPWVGIEPEKIRRRYVTINGEKFYLDESQSVWYLDTLPQRWIWNSDQDDKQVINKVDWWNKFIKKHGDHLQNNVYLGNSSDNWAINTILKAWAENNMSLDDLDPEMSKKELHSLAKAINQLVL